ncbi:MAG TPA: metallophosphoesterase family protein [Geminicoccaceae bacterium]|nr:metallophosphoesterase family protein [Geminicoccaceae bacterium]
MLKRLFQRGRPAPNEVPLVAGRQPRLPEGVRIYAVGDVHGRIDLLRRLEAMIVQDVQATGWFLQNLLVFIGDYVDRGFHSREVLEHLVHPPRDGLIRVHLLGNHDVWLREYARGEPVSPAWLRFGGDATLASYGVPIEPGEPEERTLDAARPLLQSRLPATHLAFLGRLELAFSIGDYFFCHAGIRPTASLADQNPDDLIWIRDPFLDWRGDIGKIVVHGHTIEEQPAIRRNRIGIDTGAYSTGNLTCLVIEGRSRRFLSTLPAAA